MTAKHRKGKNNHKHEDNFFKNDILESEVRAAGNNYTLALVLIIVVAIGGAIGAWFCFQQHQTLTYLTDNIMGVQMKIAKLQSSHEELRQSNGKHISEGLVSRLTALEESYSLAQKQVGMALATAEQLKTSDLPAQVLSLHTEMKTRLAEMQQATVSTEQLGQVQSLVLGKSEEFEGVRLKLEALVALSDALALKVEALENNLGAAESKLTEKVATLSASLDGQASEVLSLREQLEETSGRDEDDVPETPEATEVEVEEQLEQVLEEAAVPLEEEATEEETVVLTEEAAPADTEEEVIEEQEAAPEEALMEEEEAAPEEPVEEATEDVADEELSAEAEEAVAEQTKAEDAPEVAETEDIPKEEVLEQPEEVEETEEVTEEIAEEDTQTETIEEAEESTEAVEKKVEEQEDLPAEDTVTAEEVLEAEAAEIPEVEQEEQVEPEPQPEDNTPLQDNVQDALQDK